MTINWYFFLIAGILVLTVLFGKEWKRRNKRRLALRMISTFLAVASLVVLAYPFKKNEQDNGGSIIVLTEGYSPDSLKNLQLSRNRADFFTPDLSLLRTSGFSTIKFIPDLKSFAEQHNNDTVHLFGNGLDENELNQIDSLPFIFHPPFEKPAIQTVYWKDELKPGEPFILQGQYNNNLTSPIKINLQAFGEIMDSALIPRNSQQNFSLKTIPKQTGRAVYRLLVNNGKDTLANEPLPINISPAIPAKLLLLSSSPDFEKTFLKNRLAQNGYEITVSTAISKGKKDERFVNMPKSGNELFSAKSLEQFDVIITDDAAVAQLNAMQITAMRIAIEEKGLGLIIKLSDEAKNSAFYSPFFSPFLLKQDKKDFVTIRSAVSDSEHFKIKIDEPVCLRDKIGTQVLLRDDNENIYAAAIPYGLGKIVATTLNNTYTIALAGNTNSWQSLWSLLLEKTIKTSSPGENWHSPSFAFVNKQSVVTGENIDNTGAGVIGNSKIYMRQDSLLPYQWHGQYWPVQPGWQPVIHEDGIVQHFYVFGEKEWKPLQDLRKKTGTMAYAQKHTPDFVQQRAGQRSNWTSHLKLYLVILFFLCCSVLWVEQKLG